MKFKKSSLVTLLGLGLIAASLQAAPLDGILRVAGGLNAQTNKGTVLFGDVPGAVVNEGFVGVALVNITAGDVLVGPLGTSLTARMGVSKTATAGDTTVIGIAQNTAVFGANVNVAVRGLIRCTSNINVTLGQKMATSATAGQLTATSSLTAANYTGLSGTPTIVTATETRSSGGGGSFLGYLGQDN